MEPTAPALTATGDSVAAIVAILALVAAIIFGIINARQAAESARQSKRSADSAEKSLGLAADQLQASVAAQAESLRLAQVQLENSVRAHQDSQQPYIWADIRTRDDGGLLMFMVGNSGPRVATNIHVTFEPPLNHVVPEGEVEIAHAIEERGRTGLRSLPPGRVFRWSLGSPFSFFDDDGKPIGPGEITISITADGPHGPLAPSSYTVSLADLSWQSVRAEGAALIERPLKAIERRINELNRSLGEIRRALPKATRGE